MREALALLVKGAAGGALVVAFALLSQALRPKRFAGLFGAAPAVALAGLTVMLVSKGSHDAHRATLGMIAGGVGMTAYAALAVPLLRSHGARAAAALSLGVWVLATALAGAAILLP